MNNRSKGKAPSPRQLKVGELIRHALADIFSRGEIVDAVLNRHSLTVPEVRMTPDLKRYLRGLLAKRVSLKFMPELRFKVDTSFEASARIDELLASPKVARDLDDSDE